MTRYQRQYRQQQHDINDDEDDIAGRDNIDVNDDYDG